MTTLKGLAALYFFQEHVETGRAYLRSASDRYDSKQASFEHGGMSVCSERAVQKLSSELL